MKEPAANKCHPLDYFMIFFIGAFLTLAVVQGAYALGLEKVGGTAGTIFLNLWVQDLFFLMGVVFFLRFRGETWRTLSLKHPARTKDYFDGILWGVGLYLAMLVIVNVMNQLWPGGLAPQNVEMFLKQDDAIWKKQFVFLSMAVLAPLVEEILYRGYLFHALCNKMTPMLAMVLTSIIFGCMHFDIQRAIPLAIGGFFLNLIAYRYESILVSTVAHGTWNALMIGGFYFIQQ